MKILFLFVSMTTHAVLPGTQANRIVDAIWVAEGGNKARVPFGILSVSVSGYKSARSVCYRTVQNTHDRWIDDGMRGDFITFLGSRYCPFEPETWVKNVRKNYETKSKTKP